MDNVDGVAGLLVWNIHFLHNMISSHLGLVALIHLKSKNLQTFYQSATFHEKKRSNAVCTNHLIVLKKDYWTKQNFKTSAQKKTLLTAHRGQKWRFDTTKTFSIIRHTNLITKTRPPYLPSIFGSIISLRNVLLTSVRSPSPPAVVYWNLNYGDIEENRKIGVIEERLSIRNWERLQRRDSGEFQLPSSATPFASKSNKSISTCAAR